VRVNQPVVGSFSRGYERWLLCLLLLVTTFSFGDRVIIQVLGQAIKEDLSLTDLQLGLLSGLSFALLYSCVGFPIARMAERRSRVAIMSTCVGVFSIMSGLCGLSQSFWQLFLCRVGVGIGEAGVQPPGVSLISDHFPPSRRGMAVSVMQLGAPVGSVLGGLGGGWIGHLYGWRTALLALAIPGLILALAFRLTLRDPARGMSDPDHSVHARSEPPPFGAVLTLLGSKTGFRHMLIGLAVGTTALYGSGAFLPIFFARVYGLGLAQAATMYAITIGVAGAISLSISGVAIDRLSRRGQHWYALLPALGLTASVPAYVAGYMSGTPYAAIALIASASVFMLCFQAPTMAAFQNMVGAQMRASAAFVYSFTSALIGLGVGPPLVGFLSDRFAARAFGMGDFSERCAGGGALVHEDAALAQLCTSASATGVRYALASVTLLFLWGAAHYFVAYRRMAARQTREAATDKTLLVRGP